MAYKKVTISWILDAINSRQMYLPAIQRKYVWSDEQITRLMDSIMLDYPIGTFLFWRVKKRIVNQKEYSMYEFIKDFHERDAYKNPPAPQPFPADGSSDSIWAVLDGQQRLTSLYIALQGSISRKLPMKRWANNEAFPQKELYFNLRSQKESEDDDITYEFAFLAHDSVAESKPDKLWYRVKDILQYKSPTDVMTQIVNTRGWNTDSIVMTNILKLHEHLVTSELINYFEVEEDAIDSVLDIFVRVNSGGTVLSKSDLLFSTVVSHWDKARDKIDELLTRINRKGEGFRFSNDFIMRSSLYLINLPTTLKVETFRKDSVLEIRNSWPKIENAIAETVDLLCEFGFNAENLVSYVAAMPIVYYRFHGGPFDSDSKRELKKYIVVAQLKQVFGASNNSALQSIREKLKDIPGKPFSLSVLQGIHFSGDRTLCYTQEEIDALFDREIGSYTFMVLSLLYPNLKYSQKGFHQDHMHPYAGFTTNRLKKVMLPDGSHLDEVKIYDWQHRRNTLANLQLLEGRENEQKNKTPLADWLQSPENAQNAKYLPFGISYDLGNFEEFMEKRQELMAEELKRILL